MNYELERRHHISFCGSYCHICDWHTGRIRKTFRAGLHMFDELGLQRILPDGTNGQDFRRGLESLMNSAICPGCKPQAPVLKPDEDRCKIRQCCYQKGLELCSECEAFPCATLKTTPAVLKFRCLENLACIRDKGIKYWIDKEWEEAT
jgi:hypothetical protein